MTSEQALRRMRQRVFDYPPHKQEQAERVIHYLKKRALRAARKERLQASKALGPYSGLTRAELTASRTCEPDWY